MSDQPTPDNSPFPPKPEHDFGYVADPTVPAAFKADFLRNTARLHSAQATEVGEMALNYALQWAQMHAEHNVPSPEKITEAAKEFESFLKYGLD